MTWWSIAETTTDVVSQLVPRRSDRHEELASISWAAPVREKGLNLRRTPAEVEKVSTRSPFQVQIAIIHLVARAAVDPPKMMIRPCGGGLQRLVPSPQPLRPDIVSGPALLGPWRPFSTRSVGCDKASNFATSS
jgi:hypothetical protein